MMLRITLLSGLALASLAACGDDSGGGGGSGGGDAATTGASTTGATTATTGATTATTTATTATTSSTSSSGEGGSGAGTSGSGGGAPAYDCASYCDTVTEACTGDLAQYPNAESCQAACAAFGAGEFEDTGNTLGCRSYHASVALDSPDIHCEHAGPLGTGACSADATSPCEAFCQIAEEICPDAYAGDCEKSCAAYADGEYSASNPDAGDTLACRMYHLTVAAQGGDNLTLHCPHVGAVSDTCPG